MIEVFFVGRCEVECLHGSCGDGACMCDEGWRSIDCSERECLPGCEQHGHCNNGTCICNKGWNGENCFIGNHPKVMSGRICL